jgi:4-amino-4-deoxy-L-arabinose transferase-like glycosyltransferase
MAGEVRPSSIWPSVLCLVLVYALSAGWGLWAQPIENPDEPRYADPARLMAEGQSGWLVPIFNQQPRTVKPILLYWALAAAAKVGGALGLPIVFAFRLVPWAAGLLSVLAAYGLGRRLFGARVGLLAGLILTTSFYFHEISRELLTDPLLTGFLAAAWYGFVAAVERIEKGPAGTPLGPLAILYLGLGMACLTKGPVLVAVFAVLPMVVYLVWERKRYLGDRGWRGLLWRGGLWWGLPLALAVGFSWFAALWWTGHGEEVRRFFVEQNLMRAAGELDKNKGLRAWPVLWYLDDLVGHVVPWVVLAIPAAWWSWRARGKDALGPQAKLLLCALVIPFLLMGCAGSKRSLYLLPLYPLLAVWIGMVWERFFLAETAPVGPRRVWGSLLGLVAVLCALAALGAGLVGLLGLSPRLPVNSSESWGCLVAGALMAIAAGAALRDLVGGRRERGSLQVLLLTAAFWLCWEAAVHPANVREENRDAFYATVAKATDDRPLVWFGGTANEIVWYLRRPVDRLIEWRKLKDSFFEKPGAVLIIRDREFDSPDEPSMLLRASVRELRQARLKDRVYHLVEADPTRPPNPDLFKGEPTAGREGDEGE